MGKWLTMVENGRIIAMVVRFSDGSRKNRRKSSEIDENGGKMQFVVEVFLNTLSVLKKMTYFPF